METIKPLSAEQLATITIPEFVRVFTKVQPAGERKFSASGTKADVIIRYLLTGGFTRDQIAFFCDASPSRVGEVMWAMDAAGVAYKPLTRKARAVASDDAKNKNVSAEVPVTKPVKPARAKKAAAA